MYIMSDGTKMMSAKEQQIRDIVWGLEDAMEKKWLYESDKEVITQAINELKEIYKDVDYEY